MKNPFRSLGAQARAHKILSAIVIIAIVIIAYEAYAYVSKADAATQYAVSPATVGSIVQTVSGTGQVQAEHQLDVTSQVSGAVTSIDVTVGERVTKGQLLATIDNTTAKNQLNSAQISYDQLVQPPKPGDVENAQNALDKSYTDAWNAVRSSFVDLQTVMTGMDSMLYEQTGFFGTGRSDYLTTTAQTYRTTAGTAYDAAKASYLKALADYESMSGNVATSSIETMANETYDTLKLTATALQALQNAVNFVTTNQTDYNSNLASSAVSSVSSWLTTVNADVSANAAARNTIDSSRNSYTDLLDGPDALQVAASKLSVSQAQQTYDDYFIRAPFDGVVGRIPVSLYDQAGASTVIATIVGDQKIANISLDEVDAAKVQPGQKVSITFDALPGLVATGTVEEVDLVGTVSGGVVSYNVKLSIDTNDDRIRPGMSLNATITTAERSGVLIVPTAAVKTRGSQSYVQVLDSSVVDAYLKSQAGARGPSRQGAGTASSATPARSGGSFRTASTTAEIGSTTASGRSFGGGREISLTIPSNSAPKDVPVTTGISDDTDTEIVSGLSPREWVVTRTVSASTGQAAPSIFSAIGNRGGGARPAGRIGG